MNRRGKPRNNAQRRVRHKAKYGSLKTFPKVRRGKNRK
jgi:hypothetical protein